MKKVVVRPGKRRSPSVQRGFYLHTDLWCRFKQKARSLGSPYNLLLSKVLKDFLDSGGKADPLPVAEGQGLPIVIPKALSDRLDREANRRKVPYSRIANHAIKLFLDEQE
jgi:hypothetical protein